MSEAQELVLAQEHMRRQVREATAIQVALGSTWDKMIDPNSLDASFLPYLRRALVLLTAGRARGTVTAEQYYAEAKRLAALDGVVPRLSRPRLDVPMSSQALLINGPVVVKKSLAEGNSLAGALALGKAAQLRTVKRLTLEASRSALTRLSQEDDDAFGWVRISDGAPCHFCAMLVSRGPVYSESGGRFQAHNGCGCSLKPCFSNSADDGWTPQARKLEALWKETGDINSFRSAYNEQGGGTTKAVKRDDDFREVKKPGEGRLRPSGRRSSPRRA